MCWIQTPCVGETKSLCGWYVESEATVVTGSWADIEAVGRVGGPGCARCWVVVHECFGSQRGKWCLVEIEISVDFLVGGLVGISSGEAQQI